MIFRKLRLSRAERKLARLQGEYRQLSSYTTTTFFEMNPTHMLELVWLAGQIEKTRKHITQLGGEPSTEKS